MVDSEINALKNRLLGSRPEETTLSVRQAENMRTLFSSLAFVRAKRGEELGAFIKAAVEADRHLVIAMAREETRLGREYARSLVRIPPMQHYVGKPLI